MEIFLCVALLLVGIVAIGAYPFGYSLGHARGHDDCIDESIADGWIDDGDKRYIVVPKDASVSDLANLWKDT